MMHDAPDRETAELLLAVAACPAGRATPAALAKRLDCPVGAVSRRLRAAHQRRLLGSAITLTNQLGRDRMFWLTAQGARLVVADGGSPPAAESDAATGREGSR